MTRKFWIDAAERIGWTAAEAAVATAIVILPSASIPTLYIPIIAAGLSALKAFVARHVGNPDSASTASSV